MVYNLALALLLISNSFCFAQRAPSPLKPQPQLAGIYPLETLYEMDKINHGSARAIINKDGQWKIQLRIGFTGAYYFGLANAKEKNALKAFLRSQSQDIQYPPDDSFFDIKNFTRNNKVSLAYHPTIKKIILEHVKAINEMFCATKERLGIDLQFEVIPVFIDEAALYRNVGVPKVTRNNWKNLIPYFQSHRQNFHPVSILPVPEVYAVSPEYWDIYSRSEYLAHEVVHIITRDTKNDQFMYADAPFDGLTNDGATFRELAKLGYRPQLDKSLFLAIVENQKSLFQIFGPQAGAFASPLSPFKDYMESDRNGRYSQDANDWNRNFERKKQDFLNKNRPQRKLCRKVI